MAQVASALAVAAVAASGYLIYTGEIRPRLAGDSVDGTGARLDAVEKRLRAQADSAAQIDARVDARLAHIENQLGQLDAAAAVRDAQTQAAAQQRARAMQELTDAVAALRADAARRDSGAWQAAEAEHLLVIANQRLQLGGDAALARRALALADARLRRAADPALTAVRARIAEEIAALDQAQAARVDAAGVLHKLAALARAADALPLAGDALAGAAPAAPASTVTDSTTATAATVDSTTATVADSAGWLAAGKNLLADLGGLVQVETIDADAPPVLPAETRALIRANAALMLQAAQVAFLQGDGAVYAERMAAAADWVGAYFTDSAAARDWLAQLRELAAVSPAQTWPDISGSLRALRAAAGN